MFIDALLLFIAAWLVVPIASRLVRRIRKTRECLAEAEQGNLTIRATARYNDELGFLERSFNQMIGEIGTLIGGVQGESTKVAQITEQLASAVEQLQAAGGALEVARALPAGAGERAALVAKQPRRRARRGDRRDVDRDERAARKHNENYTENEPVRPVAMGRAIGGRFCLAGSLLNMRAAFPNFGFEPIFSVRLAIGIKPVT